MTNQLQSPRPPLLRKPFYGWAMAAAASLAVFCSAPGQSYGFAVFIDFILRDTGMSRTEISGLYALGTGVSALTSLMVGRWVDKWGARRMLAVVGLGIGAACFVMASAGGALSLLLGFAALRALGQGSLGIIGTLLVAQWFIRYRGRAIAFMQLGGAAANALFPPLALALILAFGWRDAYRVLGVSLWLILIPLAILVVRNRPESMGLNIDGQAPVPLDLDTDEAVSESQPARKRLWRTRQFWLIVLPLVASPFIITALVFHQTSIFASRGLSTTVAAAVFVPLAIASAVVAALAGVLVDRVGPRNVLLSSLGLLFLALLQLQILHSPLGATVYAVTIGTVLGMSGVAGGVIWAHYYGREGLGRIQGTASMVMISAAALAPLPLAALQESGGSYARGLALYALLPVVCAGILLKLQAAPARVD